MDSVDLGGLLSAQFALEAEYEKSDSEAREKLVDAHIASYDSGPSMVRVPEFDYDSEWINTSRSLTMAADLSKKVVVMDFFTYCCINCMHVLPYLEELEELFPVERGVTVVGVHSAKFENERVIENVASAVLRYGIRHPIINDPCGSLWSTLQITCWPTMLILGPAGQVLFVLVGEGHREKLLTYVQACVEFYDARKELSTHQLPLQLLCESLPSRPLLFPGKISCYRDDATDGVLRVAIADTGHHRVLVTSEDGIVQETIGGTQLGFADGNFKNCRFRSPQGIAWKSTNTLYVADTENHAIREINLRDKLVTTVIGVVSQPKKCGEENKFEERTINSPWDLWVWQNSEKINQVLLIAMAGCHQIWGYGIKDSVMPNGIKIAKGAYLRLAGSGREENRNNRYPHMAAFAQPSGLCVGMVPTPGGEELREKLFVADSESSTIREIDMKTMAVKGLVGGGRDPTDLFKFGDKDGVGLEVKLQHPLGLAWSASLNQLYVADSYNHKIKLIDVASKECKTYCGRTTSANKDPIQAVFNEPGGLCICGDGNKLLVADTNNHKIKVVNLERGSISEMQVRFLSDMVFTTSGAPGGEKSNNLPTLRRKPNQVVSLAPIPATPKNRLNLTLNLSLGSGLKLNKEAPNTWTLYLSKDEVELEKIASGKLTQENPSGFCTLNLSVQRALDEALGSLILDGTVYVCDEQGCCHARTVQFRGPISREGVANERLSINHDFKLS